MGHTEVSTQIHGAIKINKLTSSTKFRFRNAVLLRRHRSVPRRTRWGESPSRRSDNQKTDIFHRVGDQFLRNMYYYRRGIDRWRPADSTQEKYPNVRTMPRIAGVESRTICRNIQSPSRPQCLVMFIIRMPICTSYIVISRANIQPIFSSDESPIWYLLIRTRRKPDVKSPIVRGWGALSPLTTSFVDS